MAKKERNVVWEAEKRSYEKIFNGVTGKPTRVRDVEQDAIAYTDESGNIYLSEINELNKDLNPVYQRVFRKGVFVHEMLHQIFTNFKVMGRMIRILPEREKQVYSMIHNILEDPAIEYWAPTVVGGHLTRALRYAIALTYELSPGIESAQTAFGQWVNAMIQFGDMGLIKGYFTFPEAKVTFFKTSELFNKGIVEPNGAKRCQIARDLMEATRPLWEEDLKNQEAFEKMMKEIMDMMEAMGKNPMNGPGSGQDGEGEGDSKGEKSSRRKKVIEVTPEEFEEMMKGAKPGKGEGDTIVKVKGGKPEGKDGEGSTEGEMKESNGNDEGEYKPQEDKEGSGRITYEDGEPETYVPDGPAVETNEDLILSDEELEYIEKEAQKALEDYNIETEKAELEENNSSLPNFDIESPRIGKLKCLNYRIGYEGRTAESLEIAYSKAVSEMNGGIKNVTSQLKRIFKNDVEEKEYRSSGKINVKRLNTGKRTVRVFDKRRAPTEKSDLAVFLLIDESGSMSWGNKSYAASRCAIALAEVFNNVNVPIYIMGFTADCERHDAVHNHYVTWDNTHKNRLKLLNIAARSNNADGYSIRYATKILEKYNAKNKLLIVVSDGQPAASCYSNGSGVADTKDAIRDAKKKVSVLGVAIGNSDTEVIYHMYEKNFLHISKVEDLFANLAGHIKKLIREWD